MSVNDVQTKLHKELLKRVRVAVQEDGYHDTDFAAVFDAYRDSNLLNTLEEVKVQLENLSGDSHEAHRSASIQFKEIQEALSEFSSVLAKKAAGAGIGKIEKVNPKVFDSYARRFEMDNKKKLSVVMPTLLSAFLP